MARYEVTAVPWAGGWELHVDGVGVTQSRTLDAAEQQVRDFLATLLGEDASTADVAVRRRG